MSSYTFEERLAWSEFVAQSDEDLLHILRARIPGCIRVVRATLEEDRHGTDYWAHRAGGLRPLSIDLKARSLDPVETYDRDDVALEIWSVVGERVGWTRDIRKETDYILWLWTPTRRFFLVPFPALCEVFRRYWATWQDEYETHIQHSDSWRSQCVYVPRSVLIGKLNDWMEGAA